MVKPQAPQYRNKTFDLKTVMIQYHRIPQIRLLASKVSCVLIVICADRSGRDVYSFNFYCVGVALHFSQAYISTLFETETCSFKNRIVTHVALGDVFVGNSCTLNLNLPGRNFDESIPINEFTQLSSAYAFIIFRTQNS